jgi:hypothetical protein
MTIAMPHPMGEEFDERRRTVQSCFRAIEEYLFFQLPFLG